MATKFIAIGIFILIYIFIMSGKVHRTIISIWGALLFVAFPTITREGIRIGLLNRDDILHYVNWEALGLIFGMFTLVAALRESGFFRWFGLAILKLTKFDPLLIFVLFSATAAVLSAFMDSITVLLFMATLTLEVCGLLKISPYPYLFLEISAANIGGSATMVGDPPNIIIGTSYHFAFIDFAKNTAPIAIIILGVNTLFFYFLYRNMFKERRKIAEEAYSKHFAIEPKSAVTDRNLMVKAALIFMFVIGLLTTHHILNLSVAFIGLLGASLVLLLGGEKMPEIIERIDWNTLIFFASLFIMVGGLDKTGVLTDIANGIGSVSHGNIILAVLSILWMSAILSAFIDNVPFAAAMVPIVKNLSSLYNIPLTTMSWALALGTDIGGNGTPIGASANVVGLSVAEKRTGEKVKWGSYCKVAFPAMILSIVVASILIYLRYLI